MYAYMYLVGRHASIACVSIEFTAETIHLHHFSCALSCFPCLAFLVLLGHVTPRVKQRQKQHLHAPMLLPFLRKKGLKPP